MLCRLLSRQRWAASASMLLLSMANAVAQTAPSTSPANTRPEKSWIRLFGENDEAGNVKLVWQPMSWESGVDGFHVMSSPANSAGAWEKRSTTPILPGLAGKADLSNVESDPSLRQALEQ